MLDMCLAMMNYLKCRNVDKKSTKRSAGEDKDAGSESAKELFGRTPAELALNLEFVCD